MAQQIVPQMETKQIQRTALLMVQPIAQPMETKQIQRTVQLVAQILLMELQEIKQSQQMVQILQILQCCPHLLSLIPHALLVLKMDMSTALVIKFAV
jgi:hypothetical protein